MFTQDKKKKELKLRKKLQKKRSVFAALVDAESHGEYNEYSQKAVSLGTGSKKRFAGGLFKQLGRGGRILAMLLGFVFMVVFFGSMGLVAGKTGISVGQGVLFSSILFFVLLAIIGIFFITSQLFLSQDLLYYLALPIESKQLWRSKMLVVYLQTALYNLAAVSVYFGALCYSRGFGWQEILSGALCLLLTTHYQFALLCIVISLICASLRRLNRKRFNDIMGSLIIVLALGIGVGSQFLPELMAKQAGVGVLPNLADQLTQNPYVSALLLILAAPIYFLLRLPSALLALGAGLLSFLLLAAANYMYGKKSYLPTVTRLLSAGEKRSRKKISRKEGSKYYGVRSSFKALAHQDVTQILRTPVHKQQIALSALLMPLYFLVIFVIAFVRGMQSSKSGALVRNFAELRRWTETTVRWNTPVLGYVALALIGSVLFFCMSNIASSVTLSRDGETFFFLKALPISPRTYLYSRLRTNLFSLLPALLVPVVILLLSGLSWGVVLFLLALLLFHCMTIVGVTPMIDILSPRLHWKSEMQLYKSGKMVLKTYATLLFDLLLVLPEGLLAYFHYAKQFLGHDIFCAALAGIAVLRVLSVFFFLLPFYVKRIRAQEG